MLREAGIDYPSIHRDNEGLAHHLLARDLSAGWNHAAPRLAELDAYIASSPAGQIILSSEAFTNCLQRRVCLDFMRLVELLGKRGSVSVVLALRRIDSFLESMYLHSTKVGETTVGTSEYLEQRVHWTESFFAAVAAVRNTGLLTALHLIKYERMPRFQGSILDLMGVGPGLQSRMPALDYRGEKLGLKGQVLLLHLGAVGERVGIPLERRKVIRALEDGSLTFADDRKKYSVLSLSERRQLHRSALKAAAKAGLPEYETFFGQDDPEEAEYGSLDMHVLTFRDLEQVTEWGMRAGGIRQQT